VCAAPMKAVPVDTPCPMCRATGGITLLTTSINVPYFGDALESTLRCSACRKPHADFMILSQKEPTRLSFRCESADDLLARVIRSNSGTIRIPELGFAAEPTPLSESFVSNVEGVLERAKDILLTALDWHGDDPQKRALLEHYLAQHELFMNGRAPFTLIIDDPYGNSAIVAERVERRGLTPEEVAGLRTGMHVIDKSELAGADEP